MWGDNMDWMQLIGTLGFPIVACICMALYVKEQSKENREDIKLINEQHNKEMTEFKDQFVQALNNNTIALTKLCEKLERGEVIK